MLMLAHEVAGRLRFISPALKGDRGQAGHLERQVRAVPGVTDVQVRSDTGSLIVRHDGEHATREAIFRALPLAVLPHQARRPRLLDELADTAAQQLLILAARGVLAALL